MLTLVGSASIGNAVVRAQADTASVAAARAALAQRDFAKAMAIADARLRAHPDDRDAQIVFGLGAFQAGAYGAALSRFDMAIASYAEGVPAAVRFDRAACLYALGRFAEAEQAFLETAAYAETELGALASLNAGFSALELAAYGRAREHLGRARELDVDRQLASHIAELAAEIDGVDVQRSTAAEPKTPAAPADARARSGDRAEPDARGDELGASVALGIGYDSDPTQTGLSDSGAQVSAEDPARPSAFGRLSASLWLERSVRPGPSLSLEYDVDQLAYAVGALDVWNSQDHALEVAGEQALNDWLRLRIAGRGLLSMYAIQNFALFGWGGGVEIALAARYAAHFETVVESALIGNEVVANDYTFLTGTRFQIGIVEQFRSAGSHARFGMYYRDELIGTQRLPALAPTVPCLGCEANYVMPLGYRAARLSLDVSQPVLTWLHAFVRGSAEWRFHVDPTYFELIEQGQRSTSAAYLERERRLRVGSGLLAALPLGLGIELDYDLTLAHSNLDGVVDTPQYANRDFVRQTLELALSADF